jgi:Family of unknown function (DUF6496)
MRWTGCGRAKKNGVLYLRVLRQSARLRRLPIGERRDGDTGAAIAVTGYLQRSPYGSVYITASQTSEPPRFRQGKTRKAAPVIRTLEVSSVGPPAVLDSSNSRNQEAAMARYGKAAGKTVRSAMRRRKHGTLRSGKGGKGGVVKSRKQAIAIGLSEARKKGSKVPRKTSS